MTPTQEGSFKLFRFSGIDVFVHWSWFAVAIYEFQTRHGLYSSPVCNALEYIGLFGIVLLHEFGHALACRQSGGQANQIVLWPLGGVAYVAPPPRPGPILWSIAAGPLVNVLLIPTFMLLKQLGISTGFFMENPDSLVLIKNLAMINFVILLFNLLPIYPLDGGQILRALLWFVIGPIKSLFVATSIGFLGVAGLVWWAIQDESIWIGIMAFFVFVRCRAAWMQARAMSEAAKGF